MKKQKLALPFMAGCLFLEGLIFQSYSKPSKFMDDVEPSLEFRPRWEYVEDKNNNSKSANALTIRTLIGAKINSIMDVKGLQAHLEAINVSALVDKFSPQKDGYDLVADPNNTRISRAYISYKINKTTFSVGRKFLIIDDHRFIGNVAWRQMPQSFGVFEISDNTVKNLNILIAGIYERKGIVDKLNDNWNIDKMPLIFDINYQIFPELKIKGFAYLVTDIHNTYGLKASGKANLAGFSISYIVEYAKQTDPYQKDDIATKPDIDTQYYRLNLETDIKGIVIGAECTHFGDKNGKSKGFSIPFSTLHKFEGWSDVLLDGAVKGYDYGLNEYKFTLGYKSSKIGKMFISYLVFNSVRSQPEGNKIGTEINAIYTKNLTKRLSFLAKAAFYNAKNGYYTNDTLKATKNATKHWIQLDFKY